MKVRTMMCLTHLCAVEPFEDLCSVAYLTDGEGCELVVATVTWRKSKGGNA